MNPDREEKLKKRKEAEDRRIEKLKADHLRRGRRCRIRGRKRKGLVF